MRPVAEISDSDEKDIQHLKRILRRAAKNKRRVRSKNSEIVNTLSTLLEDILMPELDNGTPKDPAMRQIGQTAKGEKLDLKHLRRILERAKNNTTRPSAKNREVVALLSQLVKIYTEEDLQCDIDVETGSSQYVQD